MDEEIRMTVRLPKWATDYLDGAAKENFTSRNAEIVRSIRERVERGGDNAALPGGIIN